MFESSCLFKRGDTGTHFLYLFRLFMFHSAGENSVVIRLLRLLPPFPPFPPFGEPFPPCLPPPPPIPGEVATLLLPSPLLLPPVPPGDSSGGPSLLLPLLPPKPPPPGVDRGELSSGGVAVVILHSTPPPFLPSLRAPWLSERLSGIWRGRCCFLVRGRDPPPLPKRRVEYIRFLSLRRDLLDVWSEGIQNVYEDVRDKWL